MPRCPQVPGAATAAGTGPVLKRSDLCCSFIPLLCPVKGLQPILSRAPLALRSLMPGVSLSQEAGPGHWPVVSSLYHGAGLLQ